MKVEAFGWTLHIFRHRQTGAERHAKWRKKCLKQERCTVCGNKVKMISTHTGQKYRKCKKHRLRENQLSKLKRNKPNT